MGAWLGHTVLWGWLDTGFGHSRPGTASGLSSATQQRYPPLRKPTSRSAGSSSLLEDGHTPWAGQVTTWGLQMAWSPRWSRWLRCQLCAGLWRAAAASQEGEQPTISVPGQLGRSSVTRTVLAVRIRPQQAQRGCGARCCGKRAWKSMKRTETIR